MDENIKIGTNYIKRLIADVIDTIIIFTFIIALYFFAGAKILDKKYNLKAIDNEYITLQEESNLYVKGNYSSLTTWDDKFSSTSKTKEEQIEKYIEVTVLYYKNESTEKLNNYNDKMISSNYFIMQDEMLTLDSTANVNSALKLAKSQYKDAVNDFKSKERVNYLNNRMNKLIWTTFLICSAITFIIFSIAIPLFSKRGQTIGKLIEKQYVVKQKNLEYVKYYDVLLRGTILFVFVILIPYFLGKLHEIFYTLPLTINLLFILLSPKHYAIHDYIAKTVVVTKEADNYGKYKNYTHK